MSKVISFRIDDILKDELDFQAMGCDLSFSDYVRNIIEEYAAKNCSQRIRIEIDAYTSLFERYKKHDGKISISEKIVSDIQHQSEIKFDKAKESMPNHNEKIVYQYFLERGYYNK